MAYNVDALKTADDCRTVMDRAKVRDPDLYNRAFRRLCELEEKKFVDPLEREFWASVAAYEQLLTEKNGRTTKATRVRNKLKRLGGTIEAITQMLEAWALDRVKIGFENLLGAGMPDRMAEYIVAYRFPDRFSQKAIESAKAKLDKYGIAPP
jgi:hypothetical protein